MVQAQLASLLGLHGTNLIPVTTIASFAANANTEKAYRQFCKDLCQIGITEEIIRRKEDEIWEILRSQSMVASQVGGSSTTDEDQVLEMAYKQFCEELFQIGVTKDLIPPKYKVLGILKSQGKVASGGRNAENKGGSGCSLFVYVYLLTYK